MFYKTIGRNKNQFGEKWEKCVCETENPNWIDPNDILQRQVQTRNKIKQQNIIKGPVKTK